MWFDSWNDVFRIVLVGASSYVLLVLLLRVSGKRTLAKLNAFDFLVTIALGSTLATVLLDSRTSLADGVVAMGLLIALQFLAATATGRVPRLRAVLTAGPSVLVLDGEADLERMRRHRVTLDEVRQAARASGFGGLDLVAALVLETDGSMSVISRSQAGDRSNLPAE